MKSIVQVVQSLLKPYIDTKNQTLTNSIAPIEDGTNYSKTYYKGDEFYRSGVLYKVTASSVNSSTAINTGSGGNATIASDVTTQISTKLDNSWTRLTSNGLIAADVCTLSDMHWGEYNEYFIEFHNENSSDTYYSCSMYVPGFKALVSMRNYVPVMANFSAYYYVACNTWSNTPFDICIYHSDTGVETPAYLDIYAR